MAVSNLEELLGLLSRRELLQIAREGRDLGYFRPTYPLSHYDAHALRRFLRRHIERLARLPSVQQFLNRYTKTGKERPSTSTPSSLPPLAKLLQQLFPGVYGMERERELLVEWVYLPLAAPKEAQRYGVSLSPTLLVEGSPGNGKSYLVRQFSQASGFYHRIIHTPALATKWYGETERRLRMLIHAAFKEVPAILIFEEIDALFPDREQNLEWLNGPTQQFLLLLDEIKEKPGIAVIGITNRAQKLDPALLRPGRFDKRIHVTPPDYIERLLLLSRYAHTMPFSKDVSWEKWAEITAGYSRAEILFILREAGFRAFLRHYQEGTPQVIREEDLYASIRFGWGGQET
ncbi:MAG: ATP-binding protein [Bacteroidia bacterium]|nr:ATP-binding protein [Bacteroidia bacterium]MDW8133963.1 ATP-binding protein [Bacteroidia bacterium]